MASTDDLGYSHILACPENRRGSRVLVSIGSGCDSHSQYDVS